MAVDMHVVVSVLQYIETPPALMSGNFLSIYTNHEKTIRDQEKKTDELALLCQEGALRCCWAFHFTFVRSVRTALFRYLTQKQTFLSKSNYC